MLPVHGLHSEHQGAGKRRFWWLCPGFLLILCDPGTHTDALVPESTPLMGGLVQAVISSMFPHCLLFAGQCCQQSILLSTSLSAFLFNFTGVFWA